MSGFEVPMQAIRVTDQSPEWLTGHKELYEGLVKTLIGETRVRLAALADAAMDRTGRGW